MMLIVIALIAGDMTRNKDKIPWTEDLYNMALGGLGFSFLVIVIFIIIEDKISSMK